jgi:hypothetical protein
MIDLYLRAADEAAALAALQPLGYGHPDGAWNNGDHAFALEAGFPVVATPATFDGAGALVTPPVLAPGFHLNIRLLDPAREAALRATGLVLDPPPATPARTWA